MHKTFVGNTNFTAPIISYWQLELAGITSSFVKAAQGSLLRHGYDIYDQQ